MLKRTSIEIDEQLLERAQQALGSPTIRATVEEALRRAAEAAEDEQEARRQLQVQYLETLGEYADLDVLRSGGVWR